MTMVEEIKIGTSVVWKVRKYGSGLYMRVPNDDVWAFGIKAGDRLRLKLESVIKRKEGE